MCDRNCFKNSIAVIFIIFIAFILFFRFGPKIPLSVLTQTKGEPLVVSGTGKITVTPDIAVVSLGIEENGTLLKNVQDSVNKKSKNLTDSLKKLGIGESDIKTTSYYVYPTYNYEIRPARIVGYRVSVNYRVKVKDFDKVNEILVKATEIGVNEIGNIAFEINEETKKEKLNEARKEAVDEAKEKAEGLAKAAGISLGKIINVSENQNDASYRGLSLPVSGGGLAEKAITQADIQPGETEIAVTVSLSYEIK